MTHGAPGVKAGLLGYLTLFVSVGFISWPYFRFAGQIFYNRYFEATMIFNPSFAYQTYATGWSRSFHLGYPTLTEPSYLSIFTLLIVIFHATGGTVFASHAYPLAVALFTFGSMFVYLRDRMDGLSLTVRSLISFFFTVNPVTAGMVHEGYSGMMIDYALIPLSLWFIDWAIARSIPLVLGALPLAFTATSMFKLPEVAIALAAIIFLSWKSWRVVVAQHPRILFGLAAALAVNAYWAAPMILNLKTHTYLPIQDDTAGEVAVSTAYSTLSNVVISRVFGIFENDAHLCIGCIYYTSAAYTLGMSLVAVLALYGIWRSRSWKILALLVAGIVLSTGYHYQDDLLGIPYELIMQLPTFGIFRSSNVFTIIIVFCYSYGLAQTLGSARGTSAIRRKLIGMLTLSAIVLASWPMINGSNFEKQDAHDGTIPAPNFYVNVPPAYRQARTALAEYRSDGATLLLPNVPFASYRWGAYVQDFLAAYIGRPTLERWYWRENNADVDALLTNVTNPNYGAERLSGLMSSLRIDSVLVHDDTTVGTFPHPKRYGTIFMHRGLVTLYRPKRPIVPIATEDARPIVGIGGAASDTPVLEALTGRTISDGRAEIGCGRSDAGFSFILGATRARSGVTVPVAAACSGAVTLDAYVGFSTKGRPRLPLFTTFHHGRPGRSVAPSVVRDGNLQRLTAKVDVDRGDLVGLVPERSGDEILGIVARGSTRSQMRERSRSLSLTLGMFGTTRLDSDASTFVLHESNDASWAAFAMHGRSLEMLPKFVADGYANGWHASPGASILLVNFAETAFVGGFLVAIVALGFVWYLSFAPYRPLGALANRFRKRSRPPSRSQAPE